MAFTRFHDDPCRIKKYLQESTDPGRYILNTPGQGDKMNFQEDPHLRLQKWGANLRTNTTNLESDLKGLSRSNTRDCIENNYQDHVAKSKPINYKTSGSVTDQSRTTHPAWMFRDLEQTNWWVLPLNPQENTCLPFQNNLSTRILEKDNYITQIPCLDKAELGSIPPNSFVLDHGVNYST